MAGYKKEFITSQDVQNRCNHWVKTQLESVQSLTSVIKKELDSEQEEFIDTDSEFDSVSECGAKRRKLAVQTKAEILDLYCSWNECSYQTFDMEKFVKHVAGHIPELLVKFDEDDNEFYVCLWKDCGWENNDTDEISRHVNFHAYHTKLQCIGANIRGRIKLPVSCI